MQQKKIEIEDLLSVKYKKNGRDLRGFDCFGLVIEVSKRLGHTLSDVQYSDFDYTAFIKCGNEVIKKSNLKKVNEIKEIGDIVLLKINCSYENHIGVYLGDNMFIHCNCYGVHLEDISEYKENIGSVYRWQ